MGNRILFGCSRSPLFWLALLKGAAAATNGPDANSSQQMVPWLAILVAALFLLLGAICGWLVGLSGFIEVANLREVRSSLRLRNFQYLVGGLAIAFVGDYRKIGLGDNFPSIVPAGFFVLGAAAAFVLTVMRTESSIRKSVRTWNDNHSPPFHLDPEAMVREFRHSGKPAFDAKFEADTKELQRQEAETAQADAERARNVRRARHAEANRAVARCTYAVLFHRGDTLSEGSDALVESILEAACAVVRAHSSQPENIELRGSFMIFVADKDATSELRDEALFTFDDPITQRKAVSPGRYRGYLRLCQGSKFEAGLRVVLPVEPASASANQVLPGAPTAAHKSGGVAIMNVKPPDRPPGVPKNVWDRVISFFKDVEYASVTSIAVQSLTGFHGVLNVESSEVALLGEDREATLAACASLQPVAALLSKLSPAGR